MSTSITLGGWLGNLLTKVAAGATPIDGLHEASAKADSSVRPRPVRSRHFGASCDVGPGRGQTQFVRGLC
jgi:hypothetical protein